MVLGQSVVIKLCFYPFTVRGWPCYLKTAYLVFTQIYSTLISLSFRGGGNFTFYYQLFGKCSLSLGPFSILFLFFKISPVFFSPLCLISF